MGTCSSRPTTDTPTAAAAKGGSAKDTSATARAVSLAARAAATLSASASAISLDKFSATGDDSAAPARPARAPPPLTGRGAYRLGRTLGTGGFSVVRLATRHADGAKFAAKVVPLPPDEGGRAAKPRPRRASCSGGGGGGGGVPSTRAEILREISIHAGLDHPNVVKLVDHFEDAGAVVLIQELLEGGELLDSLLAADGGAYTEATAAACVAQVAAALAYLHARGVLHRDVKLDNVLLARPGDLSTLKLADFGLSNTAAAAVTVCGTPAYAAPEVVAAAGRRAAAAVRPGGGATPRTALEAAGCAPPPPPPPPAARPYGAAADNWSLGVVAFLLLAGHPPFYADTDAQLYRKVVAGDADWGDPIWGSVSDAGKSFVNALLDVNPDTRMTADAALRHPWLAAAVAPSLETRPSAALAMRRAASLAASRGGPGRAASLPPPPPPAAGEGAGVVVGSPPRAVVVGSPPRETVGGVRPAAAAAAAAPTDSGRRIKANPAAGDDAPAPPPPLSAFAKVAHVAAPGSDDGGKDGVTE